MATTPDQPKIYHITHVDNLPGIVSEKVIWSDARVLQRDLEREIVGMSRIKKRRLEELRVGCHPGTMVGEYVPFYLCPRSIMLYLLHRGNHPDVTYGGGQGPIIHLVADLFRVVDWARHDRRGWAFSDRNAGARYANFYACSDDLDQIDWDAVNATDFRDAEIKEGKQAEFLMYESFPFELVEEIGVRGSEARNRVTEILRNIEQPPIVRIRRDWYY
ncbi:MAG TPA: DUF4433 domain-containing protein [Bryobacterales bacterium]|nr:DUF4433 domain-containing protein [Bryobacterales bacterium]